MNEYPSDADLAEIRNFDNQPLSEKSVTRLIEHLKQIWHWPDFMKMKKGKDWLGHQVTKIEMHTGGWSGNEEIIAALQFTLFWMLYWQKSERGGHYYFEIPRKIFKSKED